MENRKDVEANEVMEAYMLEFEKLRDEVAPGKRIIFADKPLVRWSRDAEISLDHVMGIEWQMIGKYFRVYIKNDADRASIKEYAIIRKSINKVSENKEDEKKPEVDDKCKEEYFEEFDKTVDTIIGYTSENGISLNIFKDFIDDIGTLQAEYNTALELAAKMNGCYVDNILVRTDERYVHINPAGVQVSRNCCIALINKEENQYYFSIPSDLEIFYTLGNYVQDYDKFSETITNLIFDMEEIGFEYFKDIKITSTLVNSNNEIINSSTIYLNDHVFDLEPDNLIIDTKFPIVKSSNETIKSEVSLSRYDTLKLLKHFMDDNLSDIFDCHNYLISVGNSSIMGDKIIDFKYDKEANGFELIINSKVEILNLNMVTHKSFDRIELEEYIDMIIKLQHLLIKVNNGTMYNTRIKLTIWSQDNSKCCVIV